MRARIHIKPLSVNRAYKGRRFRTDEYNIYDSNIRALLLDAELPEGPLEIHYYWGFSSNQCDADNPVKLVQDSLQKRYGFNDSRVFRVTAEKEIVNKGEEYIAFEVVPYKTKMPSWLLMGMQGIRKFRGSLR